MTNKLFLIHPFHLIHLIHLIQKTGRLTCHWVPTGDPRIPLACVWSGANSKKTASTASSTPLSTDETRGMHLCA